MNPATVSPVMLIDEEDNTRFYHAGTVRQNQPDCWVLGKSRVSNGSSHSTPPDRINGFLKILLNEAWGISTIAHATLARKLVHVRSPASLHD
jgi:hypothetical protein